MFSNNLQKIPELNNQKFITNYSTRKKRKLRGWKLHLSVEETQIKLAYEAITHLFKQYDITFKVLNVDLFESKPRSHTRMYKGGQFTIYIEEDNKPLYDANTIHQMIDDICKELKKYNILPGQIPQSDAKTFSKYFSLRNDKSISCELLQGFLEEEYITKYVPWTYVGKNFNPENHYNPFQSLLSQTPAFDVMQHFQSFNSQTFKQTVFAIAASMIAFLHEYTKIIFDDYQSLLNISQNAQLDPELLKTNSQEIIISIQIALKILNFFGEDNFLSIYDMLTNSDFNTCDKSFRLLMENIVLILNSRFSQLKEMYLQITDDISVQSEKNKHHFVCTKLNFKM